MKQAATHHTTTPAAHHAAHRQPGVLSGIRVLDFTWKTVGPWAPRLLTHYGAEVIHVERAGGWDDHRFAVHRSLTTDAPEPNHVQGEKPLYTDPYFNTLHHGKLAISLKFYGKFAAGLRNGLSQIPENQLGNIIESRLLGRDLQGARLEKHSVEDVEDLDAPLTLNVDVDPDSIFDSQVKRIHEYKRQLLNALRIVVLYNRLRENSNLDVIPRTFFFAGKAAPAYRLAKLIVKFINNLAGTIDGDPAVRGRLKVVFVPDYSVSVAERLIPASEVSNQISTAGYEASGSNRAGESACHGRSTITVVAANSTSARAAQASLVRATGVNRRVCDDCVRGVERASNTGT